MNNKVARRLFFIALILALLASGAVFIYLKSLDTVVVEEEKVTILIAAQQIPPRTIITREMITEIQIPEEAAYGSFINDLSKIVGEYSKETISKDERFHKDKIINNIEEELTLKISGNHRAVSINVNGESGVSDLIKPGDFVDVIVSLPQIKESERIIRPDISKMILQNIEVLSIDKNLFRDAEERVEIPTDYFITLSIPVYEVEKLVLAEDIGDLKLVLRPLEGDFIHGTEGIIWEELLLDDFYKMKDMFPQYEVKPVQGPEVNEGDYQYEKYYYYTIRYGDTLRSISEDFYGNPEKYELIKQVNRIEDEDEIVTGTGIKIPVLEGE
ncbi:Flp pilus assembly protein CpaB [Vallitalea okinawensis]|uniref:Flp pilus assembly protein CpaB n=1 Tax=Vallitalea okinawensis TaxID=2078660 RepID=UPI000CFAFA59|nr:Flp pilus assembly protein CpaB [Vallitalea okinawensis]